MKEIKPVSSHVARHNGMVPVTIPLDFKQKQDTEFAVKLCNDFNAAGVLWSVVKEEFNLFSIWREKPAEQFTTMSRFNLTHPYIV